MNTFSSLSQSETITSRLAAVLAVLVLASLPAVVSASSDTHANLFSGSEVAQLSSVQMSETRGQFITLQDVLEIGSYVGYANLPSDWLALLPAGFNPQDPCATGCPGGGGNYLAGEGLGSSNGSGSGLLNRNLN